MTERQQSAPRTTLRDWMWWELYVKGHTQQQIADKYGKSQSFVSERLKAVRANLPTDAREDIRKRRIDEMERLRARIWRIADSEGAPVTAGKDGDLVRDPVTGEVVRSYQDQLAASRELRAWQEREAKALGLDAATKVDMTATVVHTTAIDAELEELSRLLGLPAQEAAQAQESAPS